MSLVKQLRESKRFSPEDARRYAALLESDDPKGLDELRGLAHKMDKTLGDVEADREAIVEAQNLSKRISEGRNTQHALDEINTRIAHHDGDTRKIVKQRSQELQPLHDQRGHLLTARDEALKAITALEKLKSECGKLLDTFTVPAEHQLG